MHRLFSPPYPFRPVATRRLVAAALAVTVTVTVPFASDACAQEANLSTDAPPPLSAPEGYARFNLTLDVVGSLLGRYGLQLETFVTPHDSIAAYGYAVWSDQSGSSSLFSGDQSFSYRTKSHGGGLDVQYRHFYAGHPGGWGFFVAPGLEIQHMATATDTICNAYTFMYNTGGGSCPPPPPTVSQQVTYGGASFDLGGEWTFRPGFVIGVSGGAQYRFPIAGAIDTANMPLQWDWADGPGLRPRLRLFLGWAFG